MKKVNLCVCNNCGYLLIDTNPQVGAREFLIKEEFPSAIDELKIIDDMKACPYCFTDAYLTDI